MNATNFLIYLFLFIMEDLIAQLKGCLLDYFDWESNYRAVLVH